MIKRRFTLLSEKDERIEIMNECINVAEKHLGEMCSVFAAYARKLARFRDKHDEIAKVFKNYSEEEKINKTLSTNLESLSKAITILADYMDIEVHRLELKVVSELSHYGAICRNSRENLKTAVSARDKEFHKQKQLFDIKTKFSANSSAADSELLKIKLEVNRTNKDIDDIVENFEKTKLKDLKSILLDFITIQLKQHSKAIEILSAAYFDISNINENRDFQDFKKILKSVTNTRKAFPTKIRSQSMDELGVPPHQITTSMKQQRKDRLSASSDLLKNTPEDETKEKETEDSEDDDDESDTEEDISEEEEEDDDESDEKSNHSKSDKNKKDLLDDNDDDSVEEEINVGAASSSTKILNFKTFCEGIQVKKGDESSSVSEANSHRIHIKSINGIHPRNKV